MRNKIEPNRLFKGLFTDRNPADQPKGSYRFALNAVSETREGDEAFLSFEEGNGNSKFLNYTLNGTYYESIVVGHQHISDSRFFIFGVTNDEANAYIGILDVNSSFTLLINDVGNSILKFKKENRVFTTYRLRNGCEETVYFYDSDNILRSYTPSKTYYTTAYQAWLDAGSSGTAPTPIYNASSFDLIKSTDLYPSFDSVEVRTGGKIPSGTYNFAISFWDENGNSTQWLNISNTVPIYTDLRQGDYDGVSGSSNKVSTPNESTKVSQVAFGKPDADKQIVLTLSNLDTDYPYYRIAIIAATTGTGFVNSVYISTNQPTSSNTFIYDGNIESYTESSLDALVANTTAANIAKQKTILQAEDRMLIGNVEGSAEDYCSFQALASKITTNYITDVVDAYDYNAIGNSKDPSSYFEKVSHMGGEVYAYGIVFIFPNHIETPAYHIPGRPPVSTDRELVTSAMNPNYWTDIAHLVGSEIQAAYDANPTIEKWQVYDTATSGGAQGEMAFWEMSVNTYEAISGYPNYWGNDSAGNPLEGQKIRHHKFPNRKTVPLRTEIYPGSGNTEVTCDISIAIPSGNTITAGTQFKVGIDFDTYFTKLAGIIPLTFTVSTNTTGTYSASQTVEETGILQNVSLDTTNSITDFGIYTVNTVTVIYLTSEGQTSELTTIDPNGEVTITITCDATSSPTNNVTLLGIKFDNIELPTGAIDYRIVRAERDKYNRTVLSKGYSGPIRRNNDYIGFVNMVEAVSANYVTYSGIQRQYYLLNASPSNHTVIDPNNKYFLSPEILFENEFPEGQFVKVEGRFSKRNLIVSDTGTIQGTTDTKGGWFDNDGTDWAGTFKVSEFTDDSTQPIEKNCNILDTNYLMPLGSKSNYQYDPTDTTKVAKLYNCTADNRVGIFKLGSEYEGSDATSIREKITYVSLNVTKDVHPILDNIEYFPVKDTYHTNTTSSSFGGDTFISHMFMNTSTYQGLKTKKNVLEFIVKTIINIAIAAAAVAITALTAGAATPLATTMLTILIAAEAVGVTAQTIVLAYQTFSNDFSNSTLSNVMYDSIVDRNNNDNTFFGSMEHNYGMFVESDINASLKESYSKGTISSHSLDALKQYMIDKFLVWDETKNKYIYSPLIKYEIYKYNTDYSRENKQLVYFAFPSTYNCSSGCLEKFPNRIYYSLQSFNEETFDSYGKFLPLNYITIPGEYGPIQDMFLINNALFVQTTGALWYIPRNIQERVTDGIISLVGTGGFFASKPTKIQDDSVGALGSTQKQATRKLDEGVFFISDIDKEIYLISFSPRQGTSIEQLSGIKYGMNKWFNNNIPFNLDKQIFDMYGSHMLSINNPSNPFGIGFVSTYDYPNDRILLTKKDFKVLDTVNFQVIDSASVTTGIVSTTLVLKDLIYNFATGKFLATVLKSSTLNVDGTRTNTYEIVEASFYDTTLFENKSWTLSFSFITKSWTSFHSYLPIDYLYNRDTFFSIDGSATDYIWEHCIENLYIDYYGNQKPFIIDYIAESNPTETSIFDEMKIQLETSVADVVTDDAFFNTVIFYNSKQCSGELQIQVPIVDTSAYMGNQIKDTAGTITAKKFDKDWSINDMRDYRTDYTKPIFVSNWTAIKNNYFVDKTVDTTTIDFNKDWQQLESFRDKYLGVRFTYNSTNNTKFIIKYLFNFDESINS